MNGKPIIILFKPTTHLILYAHEVFRAIEVNRRVLGLPNYGAPGFACSDLDTSSFHPFFLLRQHAFLFSDWWLLKPLRREPFWCSVPLYCCLFCNFT